MARGGTEPRNVNGQTAVRTSYYRTLLYNLLCGQFDVECDEGIDKGYVLFNLLINGSFAVLKTPLGVLPLRCTYFGVNVFNLPTHVKVVAPVLKQAIDAELYTDQVVIYHTPRIRESQAFMSFQYLLQMYAEQMASIDKSIDMNLMNSNSAFMVEAETKAQAESIKKAYDKAQAGEPLVVYRAGADLSMKDGMHMLTTNIKNSFIVNDLYDAKRNVVNEFLTWIGVNNSPIDKKERVTTVESNSNNQQLDDTMYLFRKALEEANEERRKKFPEFNFTLKMKEVKRNDLSGNALSEGDKGREETGNVSR